MTYLNGKDILPEELFMQVQEYCAGELIYIPKKDGTRQNWGNSTGIRRLSGISIGIYTFSTPVSLNLRSSSCWIFSQIA